MHNRISLLEQEERRALKRIEETRTRADKILQHRHESLEFQKELETAKVREMDRKRKKVMESNQGGDFEGSTLLSGSVIKARRQIQASQQQKLEEALQLKKEIKK